jgi:hypothetical protein
MVGNEKRKAMKMGRYEVTSENEGRAYEILARRRAAARLEQGR